MRPYIGGSQDNSFLSVTFGYNGLGRISGNETGSVGGGNGWGTTGLGRMFSSAIGGQISWLIPSALILLAVGLFLRGRAPRTDARRAAYVVWGGWLLVTMVTFSLMAGIFHEYYTVALAPAIAALVGMGAAEAWEHRARPIGAITLAAATAAAADLVVHPAVAHRLADGCASRCSSSGWPAPCCSSSITQLHRRSVPLVVAGALVAALAGPAAYSVADRRHGAHRVDRDRRTRRPARRPGWRWRYAGWWPRAPWAHLPSRGPPGHHGHPGATRTGGGMGGLLDASTPNTEVVSALSAERRQLPLGRRRDRVAERGWAAARHRAAGHGHRRLQRQRPQPHAGAVPAVRRRRRHPLLRRRRDRRWDGGRWRPAAAPAPGSQISAWVAANYTQVTIGGSTFYDLTQPLTSTGTAPTGTTTQTT